MGDSALSIRLHSICLRPAPPICYYVYLYGPYYINNKYIKDSPKTKLNLLIIKTYCEGFLLVFLMYMPLQQLSTVQYSSICRLSGLSPRCICSHKKLCKHDISVVCENAQMEETKEKLQPIKRNHSSEYREDILVSR